MSREPVAPAPSGSKMLMELGPLLVFFVANHLGGIFWATGAFMAALALAIGVSVARGEKVPPMTVFTGVVVLVFGGLTLWLQDERFIKLKVTILNVVFGVILTLGVLTRRNFLAVVLGQAFRLDEEGWRRLTVRYACFFFFMAGVNEAIWRNFSTYNWVLFKTFGLIALMLLFTVFQLPLLKRHQLAEEPADNDSTSDSTTDPEVIPERGDT